MSVIEAEDFDGQLEDCTPSKQDRALEPPATPHPLPCPYAPRFKTVCFWNTNPSWFSWNEKASLDNLLVEFARVLWNNHRNKYVVRVVFKSKTDPTTRYAELALV